jgi:hypothetical protein
MARVLTGGRSGLGSYLVISHAGTAGEAYGQTKRTAGARAYRNASSPIIFRTRQQFAAILTGLDLVEPGLVTLTDWHPEPEMTSLALRRRRNTRGRPSAECLADQVVRRPPGAGDSRESVPPASTRRARLVSVATSSVVSAAKNSPVTSATISSASASLSRPRGVTARI